MKNAIRKKPFRAIMSSFSAYRSSSKASLPFKLKMECSAICNLKCKMCPLNEGLKRKQGVLKFSNFKKVFDEINPAYLNLTGIGEPFLNPDLFKIVKYAKEKNAMVKLDTNGTLLNQENIRKILKTKIDIISISIDGTDKSSYEKIRVGANFDAVKNNIKALVRERKKIKSPTSIHMFFVLQMDNIKKLPNFIRLGEELGVDYMAGSFVVPLGKNKNIKNEIFSYKDVKRIIKQTQELAKKVKFEVSINPLLEYLRLENDKEFYNEKKPCYMPWYSTFITWDGWVNPCDFSCDNEFIFGNAFQESFKKIWNNEKIRNFRIQILKNRAGIGICRVCSVDETYLENEFAKINKFVKFLRWRPKWIIQH